MDAVARIERALNVAVGVSEVPGAPRRLASAMRSAVFPGGARIRPRLCLAVAGACGVDLPEIADAAAASIELLHCASLVHDDLPCFDNAPLRRGMPSIHAAFGERIAVLAGDALIVLAFQTLAFGAASRPERLGTLMRTIGRSVGAPNGIVAGQAFECEPKVDLGNYQRAKTGSLFVAATAAGAQAAGADSAPWYLLGERLGEAYQVADDIRDVVADPANIGKPVGRDVALGRPSSAAELGLSGAVHYFENLVEEAIAAIPPCRGAAQFRMLIDSEARRLVPEEVVRLAA